MSGGCPLGCPEGGLGGQTTLSLPELPGGTLLERLLEDMEL